VATETRHEARAAATKSHNTGKSSSNSSCTIPFHEL
jgi:hypothetical protein